MGGGNDKGDGYLEDGCLGTVLSGIAQGHSALLARSLLWLTIDGHSVFLLATRL